MLVKRPPLLQSQSTPAFTLEEVVKKYALLYHFSTVTDPSFSITRIWYLDFKNSIGRTSVLVQTMLEL